MKSCTAFLPPVLPTNLRFLNTDVILFLFKIKIQMKRNIKGVDSNGLVLTDEEAAYKL